MNRIWCTLFVVVLAGHVFAESMVFPPYGHSYGIRKATPKHLFMFFGPFAQFDDPQGLATAKMISRDDPEKRGDDDEVVVYGVNSGNHQLIYNTSMWTLAKYGKKGSGKGEFLFPKGVATEPSGNVYVADYGNNRVVHLFNPKREVEWVQAFSGKSASDPGLKKPVQVSLDIPGNVYVSDSGNGRIAVFSGKGKLLWSLGTEFFENGPGALAVADGRDKWSRFNNDRFLFCADKNGRRLWKLGLDGSVKGSVMLPEDFRAGYAAVDYYHSVWLTDQTNHVILKYDRSLNLLEVFGSHGDGDYQFIQPRGIAIWKRYGQTFIAEKKGAQYYWMGTDLKSSSLTRTSSGHFTLSVDVTDHSYLSLFTTQGSDTLFFLPRRSVAPGKQSVQFVDRTGKLRDHATLRLEPTYSSYTYYHWDYGIKVKN